MKETTLTQEELLDLVKTYIQDRGFRTRAEMKATYEGQVLYKKMSNRGMLSLLDDILPKPGYGVAGITDSKENVEAYVRQRGYVTRKQMKHDWGEGSVVYASLVRLEKLEWLDQVLPFRKQKAFGFKSYEAFAKYISRKGYPSRTALLADRKVGAKLYAWLFRTGNAEWLDRALPKRKLDQKQNLTQEDVEKFVKDKGYRSRTEMKQDVANGGAAMMSWLWKYSKTEWLDAVLPPHGRIRKEYTRDDVEKAIRQYNIQKLTDFSKYREARVLYHWMRKTGNLSFCDGLIDRRANRKPHRIEYSDREIEILIKEYGIASRVEFSKHPATRSVYSWLSYWQKLDVLDKFLPKYHLHDQKTG